MYDIGFNQAWNLAVQRIRTLGPERVSVLELGDRVCAQDVIALIDYPSVDSSLKDGYAVMSEDVALADETPVMLKLVGTLGAGDPSNVEVTPGTTVRVLSGASIPQGADAVLAEEFTEHPRPDHIRAMARSETGRNILRKASEIRQGQILLKPGEVVTPGKVSLVVAGGINEVSVFGRPLVGLLATGSEVLMPGRPSETGKLFASNLALQAAWLRSRSIATIVRQAGDSFEVLASEVTSMLAECDVLITSGGAWKGDRDLIVKVLDALGWDLVFHRVRLGPGKALAMGLLNDKPVFCLPGGPPSNEAAFLLMALPLVLRMAGYTASPYLRLTGILDQDVRGQTDWTQVIRCRVERQGLVTRLVPIDSGRRIHSMANADGIVIIPEGTEFMPAGTEVEFLWLNG